VADPALRRRIKIRPGPKAPLQKAVAKGFSQEEAQSVAVAALAQDPELAVCIPSPALSPAYTPSVSLPSSSASFSLGLACLDCP